MACVKVNAEAPVATGLAATLKCLISASSVMWVEAPLVEYATVLPLRSPKLLSGEAAGTYQYKSLAPVVPARMIRTGAPLAKAPSTAPVPAEIPISTLPEITACIVSPPPLV
jgi:hypothetical protein